MKVLPGDRVYYDSQHARIVRRIKTEAVEPIRDQLVAQANASQEVSDV